MPIPIPTITNPTPVTTQTIPGETFAQGWPVLVHIDGSAGPTGPWPSVSRVQAYNSATGHLAPNTPSNFHTANRDLFADAAAFPVVQVAVAGVFNVINLLLAEDIAEKAVKAAQLQVAKANSMPSTDSTKAATQAAAAAALTAAQATQAATQAAMNLSAAIAITTATLAALNAAQAAAG